MQEPSTSTASICANENREDKVPLQDSSDDNSNFLENIEREAEEEIEFSKKLESSSLGQNIPIVGSLKDVQKRVGEYVIFSCENIMYPGQITKVKNDGTIINAMTKSLKFWKWPPIKDEIFYPWNDVFEGIDPPKQVSKRGLFIVPQLDKLWWQ